MRFQVSNWPTLWHPKKAKFSSCSPDGRTGRSALRKLSTRVRDGSDRGFHGNYNPGAFVAGAPLAAAGVGVSGAMDKSILKVHLPSGGFNVLKCGDATDIKVPKHARIEQQRPPLNLTHIPCYAYPMLCNYSINRLPVYC